jgi:hypothetical protein
VLAGLQEPDSSFMSSAAPLQDMPGLVLEVAYANESLAELQREVSNSGHSPSTQPPTRHTPLPACQPGPGPLGCGTATGH